MGKARGSLSVDEIRNIMRAHQYIAGAIAKDNQSMLPLPNFYIHHKPISRLNTQTYYPYLKLIRILQYLGNQLAFNVWITNMNKVWAVKSLSDLVQ